MMKQITFRADEKLKRKASQKAKKEGVNMKVLLNQLLTAYTEDKISITIAVSTSPEEVSVSPEIQEKMDHAGALLARSIQQ